MIDGILKQTGSRLDEEGVALYRRLAADAGHVGAALGIMANWDLHALERDLPRLTTRLVLVAALRDEMIRPLVAAHARRLLPSAEVVRLPGLGHLAHEERPISWLPSSRISPPGVSRWREWPTARRRVRRARRRRSKAHDRAAALSLPVEARKPHAVVIGAGLGGLAMAVRLAVRGYQVAVFERCEQAGGRAGVFRRTASPSTPVPRSSPRRICWRSSGRSAAGGLPTTCRSCR